MKRRRFLELVQKADIPGESLPGQPLLELLEDRRVLIENHRGILQYGPEIIQIKVRFGSLCVCGKQLRLCRMQENQLVIQGKIDSIQVERRR